MTEDERAFRDWLERLARYDRQRGWKPPGLGPGEDGQKHAGCAKCEGYLETRGAVGPA